MAEPIFEIVSDELRTKPRDLHRAQWMIEVFDGKTVRVKLEQTKLGGYYKTFSKEGYKLRTKADGEYTIVWAERPPKEGK
jgi:hypothetical protein